MRRQRSKSFDISTLEVAAGRAEKQTAAEVEGSNQNVISTSPFACYGPENRTGIETSRINTGNLSRPEDFKLSRSNE